MRYASLFTAGLVASLAMCAVPPLPGEGRKSQRLAPEAKKQHTHTQEIARKARQKARRATKEQH